MRSRWSADQGNEACSVAVRRAILEGAGERDPGQGWPGREGGDVHQLADRPVHEQASLDLLLGTVGIPWSQHAAGTALVGLDLVEGECPALSLQPGQLGGRRLAGVEQGGDDSAALIVRRPAVVDGALNNPDGDRASTLRSQALYRAAAETGRSRSEQFEYRRAERGAGPPQLLAGGRRSQPQLAASKPSGQPAAVCRAAASAAPRPPASSSQSHTGRAQPDLPD